jgi:hypothetical protein
MSYKLHEQRSLIDSGLKSGVSNENVGSIWQM